MNAISRKGHCRCRENWKISIQNPVSARTSRFESGLWYFKSQRDLRRFVAGPFSRSQNQLGTKWGHRCLCIGHSIAAFGDEGKRRVDFVPVEKRGRALSAAVIAVPSHPAARWGFHPRAPQTQGSLVPLRSCVTSDSWRGSEAGFPRPCISTAGCTRDRPSAPT